jgi:hypothetical protein
MSFRAVQEMRQAGNLEDALQMANAALSAEPENIWNKRAAGWVYYDYLKKFCQVGSFDPFLENLDKLRVLDLPEDEKMIFDQCAWQVGKLVYALQKEPQVDYRRLNALFERIKEFHFSRPSEAFSFLFKAFHKGHQNWSKYLEFVEWWNFQNFRPEDYLKEEVNGKKVMSIVEQSYIGYAKKLLEGTQAPLIGNILIDKEKIQSFLPQLDQIIERHPDYQYPPYFKAKLLIALGRGENVLLAFLPFAKQKRNEFWVWELMAEIFHEDKELQFACYCKALSVNTPEDFLVKLRAHFAELLIDKEMFEEAKTEIVKVIETRTKHEWKLSNQINKWLDQDWFKSAKAFKDNRELYSKYAKKAEEILFRDLPEEVVAVEFVNENKKILNFIKDKNKFGFFNYSGQLDKPKIGDVLKVRFQGNGQDGFYKVLTVKKAEPDVNSPALKIFANHLEIIVPQNFGFVEDAYVEPKLVLDHGLRDGQMLKGKAILSFNKKKKEWGWKAIELD